MGQEYTNRFGRRGGRGVRPWMLLPKVIAVGLYIGGLTAMLVVWLGSGFTSLDKADPRRLLTIEHEARLAELLVVPALLCAMGLGVALLLQHPRQFIRMRWLVVKLASLAVIAPSAHFFLSSRMGLLRRAFMEHRVEDHLASQVVWGLVVTILASVWVIALGRLKPKLGQNWARSFSRQG